MLILKALVRGPSHGYAIMRWIRKTTNDELRIEEGALYPSLHRMEKRRWVESEWGLSENKRQARFYCLSSEGRRELELETKTWKRYVSAVGKVLET